MHSNCQKCQNKPMMDEKPIRFVDTYCISKQMVSSNPTQLCRLCLQASSDVVNIWETFENSTIATILAKHFWFQVNKNDSFTEWLCQICWIQTKTFHSFYEHVEQLQKCYWDPVKSDDGGNDMTGAVDINIAKLEPNLTIVKEEPQLTSQVIDSQEDDFNYSDTEPHTSNDTNYLESSDKISPADDNRKVANKRKVTCCSSRSESLINRTIKEEQNRELNSRIREWFTLKCDICKGAEFVTWQDVKRHYRNVHQMNGYLKCCDQKFHTPCELLAHIRQHIVAPDSIERNDQIREWYTMKCDICPDDVAFVTLADMRRHYREAHEMRGYLTCCNKKFHKRHSMIAHIRNHTNPDEHRCDQCGKSFKTKVALRGHIDNHVPLDSRYYKCNFCSSSFAKAATLRGHIRNKHTSKNGEKFPCEKCKKNYRSELLLKCHIRQTHESSLSYVCEVCARQFKSKQVLQNHVKCEHSTTPQPKVQCNICNNWLKHDYALAKHIKQQHDDATPVNCPVCNKVVASKHRLSGHIRSAHAERKHECVLCDKAFKSATNLKEHVATHTGEDLYKCQYCDKKFKSNANLYSHRKKAHSVEWTKNHDKSISLKKTCADKEIKKET